MFVQRVIFFYSQEVVASQHKTSHYCTHPSLTFSKILKYKSNTWSPVSIKTGISSHTAASLSEDLCFSRVCNLFVTLCKGPTNKFSIHSSDVVIFKHAKTNGVSNNSIRRVLILWQDLISRRSCQTIQI